MGSGRTLHMQRFVQLHTYFFACAMCDLTPFTTLHLALPRGIEPLFPA